MSKSIRIKNARLQNIKMSLIQNNFMPISYLHILAMNNSRPLQNSPTPSYFWTLFPGRTLSIHNRKSVLMERVCTINKTQQENKQYFFNKEIFFKGYDYNVLLRPLL